MKGGGGYRLRVQVPRGYFHAVEISYCRIYLLWLSHKHRHRMDTHTFLSGESRHPHSQTHTNTHALTQASVMKTVSRNLQELLCAADGMACCYLPRSVEDQKNIQNQGSPLGTRFRIPLPQTVSSSQERVNQQRCLLAGCPGLWQGY